MMVFVLITLAICLIFSIFALVTGLESYDKSSDDNKAIIVMVIMIMMLFLSVVFQCLTLSK